MHALNKNGQTPPHEAAYTARDHGTLDLSVHQSAGLREPAIENLRRLASCYLNNPSARVDILRVERGSNGNLKVVIILEMADPF